MLAKARDCANEVPAGHLLVNPSPLPGPQVTANPFDFGILAATPARTMAVFADAFTAGDTLPGGATEQSFHFDEVNRAAMDGVPVPSLAEIESDLLSRIHDISGNKVCVTR